MIKIFPTNTVKDLDQYTIDHEPIRSIELVERAATAFFNEFCREFSRQTRIVVFAGQGNNGADALAVARLLLEAGYKVEPYLLNPTKHLSLDCELNRQQLMNMDKSDLMEVVTDFVPPVLGERDVVIDGLFGSGINRPLTGGFAAVVKYINQSDARVVSIDIPSGLYGEDNRTNDPEAIIRADLTYSFEFPKLAFVLAENAHYVGKWKLLEIGIHPDVIESTHTPFVMMTEEDMAESIQPRDKFAHKGSFGHALLIAGSTGKMGSAVLASKACLRSGAGLLTTHIPKFGGYILQTALPEAMASFDLNKDIFTSVPDLGGYDAIGVGPGLGQHMDTAAALDRLLQTVKKPVILDADALNIIASNKEIWNHIPPYSILTPHPKEFDRLAGESAGSYERLMKAQALAAERKICIVLKGAYTAVCSPEGNVYFNPTGNPGMGTAGSGDVLTGIILGLLAQGYPPEAASAIGVYLHGAAGDIAANINSEESLMAGDIIELLGKAFKQVK